MSKAFIAIDLGAESGRVIVVTLNEGQVEFSEVHRFPNSVIHLPSGLHWNIPELWREIVEGLKQAADWCAASSHQPISVGVDTWGVDWSLVSTGGELCGLPHAYRDARNGAAFDRVVQKLGMEQIYQATGIQLMQINSLYSLNAQFVADPTLVQHADRLMFIPDLLHYWLSGQSSCEHTIASTSQMLNVHTGEWAVEILEALGMPTHICKPVTQPATSLGSILPELAEQTGLPATVQVVLPPSHDTAAAVAAVPAEPGSNWLYISSGTWSLLGAELTDPCVSAAAQAAMFTNEVGVNGTIRFLKNIAGLWLVQQCRADLNENNQEFSYAELTEAAEKSQPFRTLLNPQFPPLSLPGGMLDKINVYARGTGQPECQNPGQYIRCCLESLAMAYRQNVELLESVLNRKFECIHVVGGGGRNSLLNQLTADVVGKRVVVGPFEATAVGNGLVQAMACGEIADLSELRQVVRNSFELETYQPNSSDSIQSTYERYCQLPIDPAET